MPIVAQTTSHPELGTQSNHWHLARSTDMILAVCAKKPLSNVSMDAVESAAQLSQLMARFQRPRHSGQCTTLTRPQDGQDFEEQPRILHDEVDTVAAVALFFEVTPNVCERPETSLCTDNIAPQAQACHQNALRTSQFLNTTWFRVHEKLHENMITNIMK